MSKGKYVSVDCIVFHIIHFITSGFILFKSIFMLMLCSLYTLLGWLKDPVSCNFKASVQFLSKIYQSKLLIDMLPTTNTIVPK